MATATVQRRAQIRDVKEYTYLWEGTDRNNRQVRGEMRAASETVVTTTLTLPTPVTDTSTETLTVTETTTITDTNSTSGSTT